MFCVKIRKELYLNSEIPGTARWINHFYSGRGLKRTEISKHTSRSDISDYKIYSRNSEDNGRTWSAWQETAETDSVENDEYIYDMEEICRIYNPAAEHLVRMRLRRLYFKKNSLGRRELEINMEKYFVDHVFCDISNDNGVTWHSTEKLTYEKEPDCNDGEIVLEQLALNEMMGTFNTRTVITPSGNIVHPVMIESGKLGTAKYNPDSIYDIVYCILVMIGQWDSDAKKYIWSCSEPLSVSPDMSRRGVFEPFIVCLEDGRLMLDLRGSNTDKTPGRRWYSISNDEGFTWSKVTDLKYDTGEQIYAPSAMSQLIRSSGTGKLYWIGNITDLPPDGNLPRHPLVLAQVKEDDSGRVAFVKDSVTVIDKKSVGDSDFLQLSNFKIIENRESYEFELFLTRFMGKGENDYTSHVFKYSIVTV